MKQRLTVFAILFLSFLGFARGQNESIAPSLIGTGTYLGTTPALRDLPPLTADEMKANEAKAAKKRLNKKIRNRQYPFAATALPKGPDAVRQEVMGTRTAPKAPIVNIAGQSSPYFPSDCNGTAGPNHYMQTVNCTYAIYSKTGALLAGPTNMNTLFSGVTGASYNDGDPIVLYDEQADRWLAAEFSISGSNDYMLVAVSTTNDPTGTWNKYSFDVADMPDYMKFGVWQDGYYMGTNNSSGNDIYVFQRSVMLAGGASPQMVGFNNPWRPTTIDGFMCVPPVDNDGVAAPAGTPGMFITINDDAIGGGSDQLWIYELAVNWSNTSASTFNRVQQLNVSPFDSNFGNDWTNIAQPGTSQQVDAIPQVIMNVPQYRNFGTYQTLVCCHTVDVDNTDHAGVRWYELRKTGTTWTIRQQGTYAPDIHSRWMGSIAMNGSGKIGLGYSISSSTVYPGIRYTGQSSAGYTAGNGIMDVPEEIIHTGTSSQTSAERWGDYSLMSIDPANDQTFWYTQEYYQGGKKTRIASFNIGNSPIATTLAASAVTLNSATLNGSVNPNGLSTTYYFQWGTTVSYGNTTSTLSAGSGSAAVSVSANLSGLVAGTTYHYRVVAVNSDGTTNGADLVFTPGAASLTTTAATGVTLISAVTGGNVITDGGSPVSARGVCWSTSTNPMVSGNHTTDGSGVGVFVSNISGLTSNTTYYIRAYATNSSGTYYGQELTFTTLCGIYSLPFNETFSSTTIPGCWSQVDNQGNGQVWAFGTITGQSPNPSLSGNYAYLNSDAYGSGNSQNADLVSPTLDLTAFTNVTLQFQHYYKHYTGSSAKLYYSINGGSTWTLIQSWTSSSTSNPTSFSQVIAAVAGQSQVKFKWNYTGSYAYYWAIDNVQITGTSSNTLAVTPINQNVTSPAGNTSFTVTSNTSWLATSNASWCTVTPSGTGNGTAVAAYDANATASTRVASITVTGTGAPTIIVTVTQSGVTPTLTVSPLNQNVTAPAGSTSFNVTSNADWTAVSSESWCTVTPSGTGNGAVMANYLENTNTVQRVANVTVTVAGLTPVVVTVTQAAAVPSLSVTPANQNVPSIAGATSFSVNTNASWTASSNASWCTVTASGTGSGALQANFTENPNTSQRIATITVSSAGLTPVAVTVTQSAANATLAVTPSNQNVTAAAGSTSFSVSSNSSWTAESSAAWCSITSSGTGNGTITADYTENTSTDARVASITVTVAGITPITVTVTQGGQTPVLNVTPSNQNVSAPAGSALFDVVSNISWTTTCNAAWCTVTTGGSGDGTITADYSENTSLDPRVAEITVFGSGVSQVVVTVTQSGSEAFLTVQPNVQNVTWQAGSTQFDIASNTNWTIVSDAVWCTVTPAGSGNGTLFAQYTENTQNVIRTANITVTGVGLAPVTVQLIQDAFVAIVEPESLGLSLYPNPTSGRFTINLDTKHDEAMVITILDVNGKILLTETCEGLVSYPFDLTGLPQGSSFLRIETDGMTSGWKLIIQ